MSEDKIDRFGMCPNCKADWNGGDALEALSKLKCNSSKSLDELKILASNYGWAEHNKIHFSNLISHEIDGRNLLECPNCQNVFDRYTGEHYRNMFDAKRNALVLKRNEFPTKQIGLADPEMYKPRIVHVTPENRQEIERSLTSKISPEIPKIDPNDIECPFDS